MANPFPAVLLALLCARASAGSAARPRPFFASSRTQRNVTSSLGPCAAGRDSLYMMKERARELMAGARRVTRANKNKTVP